MDPYFVAFGGRSFRPSSSPFRMMPRHRAGARGAVWRGWMTARRTARAPEPQVACSSSTPTIASRPA